MTITLSIILVIPIIVMGVFDKINCWRYHHNHTINENLLDIFIWTLIGVSAFLSYFAYKINIVYGIIHYSVLILLSTAIILPEKVTVATRRVPLITLIFICATMFIAIIPVSILPSINTNRILLSSINEDISVEPIILNLDNIKKSLESLESQLIEESNNINSLSEALVIEIGKQNKELQRINEEQQKLSSELEYYKSLASLSKEQTEAVVTSLNRSKYIDYIVGFAIGIFTSGIFFLLQRSPWAKRRIISLSSHK